MVWSMTAVSPPTRWRLAGAADAPRGTPPARSSDTTTRATATPARGLGCGSANRIDHLPQRRIRVGEADQDTDEQQPVDEDLEPARGPLGGRRAASRDDQRERLDIGVPERWQEAACAVALEAGAAPDTTSGRRRVRPGLPADV